MYRPGGPVHEHPCDPEPTDKDGPQPYKSRYVKGDELTVSFVYSCFSVLLQSAQFHYTRCISLLFSPL